MTDAVHVSPRGLALIEDFEGFSAWPYDDGTGVMTIGYGTTSADVSPLPSHLTRQEAIGLLARKLAEKYEPAVRSVSPANQNQFDALVSFAYNLGPGSMAWDVGRDTRAGRYQQAADAMLQYDQAGGRRLLGLTRRREAERALYLQPAGPPPDPHHYEYFPLGPYRFDKLVLSERTTVQEYDRLVVAPRSYVSGNRQRVLREHMRLLQGRIADLGGNPHGRTGTWYHRGWRWEQLEHRRAKPHPVLHRHRPPPAQHRTVYPAGGWLAPGAPVNWQRSDQGQDFVIPWRGVVQAPGDGECVAVRSDHPFPGGFGPAYPVLRIDTGRWAGHHWYIGHCTALVRAGERFTFGHPLARADQGHDFEGTRGGWVELGEVLPDGSYGPNTQSHWYHSCFADLTHAEGP